MQASTPAISPRAGVTLAMWLCCVSVIGILGLLDLVAWGQADPNEAGSVWWTLPLIIGLGVGGLAVLLWPAARRSVLAIPYGVLVVGITVFAGWFTAGELFQSAPPYLGQAPHRLATLDARAALETQTAFCVIIEKGSVPLPTPYRRCVIGGEVDYYYPTFPTGPDSTGESPALASGTPYQVVQSSGFAFRPDGRQVNRPDECLRSLGHDWWAVMDPFGAARPCASSFYFVGAP